MELETCIHCGMCSEACHFFEATRDPKYTPIHKVHLVRSVYRRELSPLRWFNRLFIRDITAKDLEDWQELLFNSCTECGRCDLMCPLGIHITRGIRIGRQALAAADLMPPELRALDQEQSQKNTLFGVGHQELRQAVQELGQQGIVVPLDRPQADVMLLTRFPICCSIAIRSRPPPGSSPSSASTGRSAAKHSKRPTSVYCRATKIASCSRRSGSSTRRARVGKDS